MSDKVLIKVTDLKKHYNDGEIKALDGVSIDVNEGEVIVIIGPSGSGKSTLLRSLNLLEHPTSGSIVLSQVEWLGDGVGGEYEAPYDSVFHYTNWYESGRLGMVDVGVRLRLQF